MAKLQVTVRLDKDQLARARKALRAETVTEAIERALALATEKATHDAIIRKYSGVGGKNAFASRWSFDSSGNWRGKCGSSRQPRGSGLNRQKSFPASERKRGMVPAS